MVKQDPVAVMEAIETLCEIAELEEWGEGMLLMCAEGATFDENPKHRQIIAWLQGEDGMSAVHKICHLFRVVRDYLKEVGEQGGDDVQRLRNLRGMISLMATVGEAARKTERFAARFYGAKAGSVIESPDYRSL